MKTLYKNGRFSVVDDCCPGLKIYDNLLKQVDRHRFGAFYDNMGEPYDNDALTAAIRAVDDAATP